MNQSLREIEIIIINDGSTDNSREIILGYAGKDSRIIFMDSVNEGVSAARNKGIDINNINNDANIAITPNNLLGIDLNIA